MVHKISKKSMENMKKIYNILLTSDKERSLAGICFDLGLNFRQKRNSVLKDIDNLCELGFLITERQTENNEFFGILHSPQNEFLYKKYFTNMV